MKSPINKFLLYILLTFFMSTASYSCALCRMQIPKVDIDVKVSALTNKTHFEATWEFDKKFVAQLMQYDLDGNGKFDKSEQDAITEALEGYISTLNYLSKITYSKIGVDSDKVLLLQPISTKMLFKNDTMYYHLSFDEDFILKKGHILKVQFFDELSNFNFLIKDVSLEKYPDKYHIDSLEHYSEIILQDPDNAIVNNRGKNDFNTKKTTKDTTAKSNIFIQRLSKELTIYKEKMKTLLQDIKKNNSTSSYLWLLLFSFIYGVIHALGPGHGKTLVGSYFLSENRSIGKAFNISLLIGVVHTFSAFLLTVVIYLLLNLFFVSFVTNVDYVATKLSAIIIIAIASYLIYKKYRSKKKVTFSAHNPNTHSCSCSACHTKSEDLGVILAAGIVPCPGTVTIFIFTSGLGIYYVGFLSAIFMSLGMSLIIFITAYLSIKVRKKSSSNTILQKIFEYGSLVFILCLGVLLLMI